MGSYKSMIITCEGRIIWGPVNWEKPNKIKRLGYNTLKCIIYGVKIKRREAKQNKKEERAKQ